LRSFKSLPDEQLVSLLTEGNKDAFGEIYNRYWLILQRRAFKKFQSKEVCEEIVQELFLTLWKRRFDLNIRVSLNAYLNGALQKMIVGIIQQEIKTRLAINGFIPDESDPSETTQELDNKLTLAVDGLPEKTKDVIKLSKYEGLPVKKIAYQLGLSNKAVEYHITKALKLLKAFLAADKRVA
jgi:RNA polymerase sigma factor (sigma-70 family)